MPSQPQRQTRSTPARRKQTERRETARQKLIQAAIDLIAERGIRKTTLGDVGEVAGYSRGLAAHHFKSKNALIEAVARDIHRRATENALRNLPDVAGLSRLTAAIENYLTTGIELNAIRALHLLQKEALTEQSEFRDVLRDFNRASIDRLESMISEAQVRGEVRSEIDCRTEASVLLATLRGTRAQWLLAPDQVDLKKAVEHITAHVERALGDQ